MDDLNKSIPTRTLQGTQAVLCLPQPSRDTCCDTRLPTPFPNNGPVDARRSGVQVRAFALQTRMARVLGSEIQYTA